MTGDELIETYMPKILKYAVSKKEFSLTIFLKSKLKTTNGVFIENLS